MNTHDGFDNHEWATEERALFDSLPSSRIPSADLKRRTIEALNQGGRLKPRAFTTPKLVIALAAAACVIFAAGAIVGYAAAQRATKPTVDARTTNRRSVANADNENFDIQVTRHVVWY